MPGEWKALIVEDSPLYQQLLGATLAKLFPAAEVIMAEDLAQGRQMFRDRCPEVVLLDISLPDGSGFRLLREIQATQSTARVVICTSHDLPEYRETASRGGAVWFLAKDDMGFNDIRQAVSLALEEARKGRTGSENGRLAHSGVPAGADPRRNEPHEEDPMRQEGGSHAAQR